MKWPKILHLPTSPGVGKTDKVIGRVDQFFDKEVLVTEKLDGENTSLLLDAIHARREDSRSHPSRSWVKELHGRIAWQIPRNLQIVGENVYAEHSIRYDKLSTFFYVFAILDLEQEIVLSVDQTLKWCQILELEFVPIFFRGSFEQYQKHFSLPPHSVFGQDAEGYVIRTTDTFPITECSFRIAKWVRAHHVQTDIHWTRSWRPNALKK